MSRKPKAKVLRAVHPNEGIRAEYRRRLTTLIEEMAASYEYWITATYRANEPEIAMDAKPVRVTAVETQIGTNKLGRVWFAYVDGEMLRNKVGVGRYWQSRAAAEAAGIKEAGKLAIVTDPVKFGGRFDYETLMAQPITPTPVEGLTARLAEMGAQWRKRIDEAAPKLAQWFRQAVQERSGAVLKKILKDGGMSVEFQMSPAMRNVAQATVVENVGLIKSIGSEYHTKIEGIVMRSVTAGRDLGGMVKEMEEALGVEKRRAARIALDQNNRATSAMTAVRQTELGLTAVWLHSHGGKVPRPTHLANTGKPYDPAVGWFDPDPKVRKHIWPGSLINCRCVSKTVVKGFS